MNDDEITDLVLIALRDFRGDHINARTWRKYLETAYRGEKSVSKAETEFAEWIYATKSKINAGPIPNERPARGGKKAEKNIWARMFTKLAHDMCELKYGDIIK